MINSQTRKWIEEITQIIGVSGNEVLVSRALQKYYKEFGFELIFDNLGSVYAVKRSKNPNAKKVMISGHLDEVGFMISKILDNGSLKILPIGGIWEQTLLAQRVRILTRDLKEVEGAICSIPPHLLSDADRKVPMKIDNMIVDIGCTTKQEVLDLGVNIGDTLVVDGPVRFLGEKRILSKAWDNRYGCIMGLEVLDYFKDKDLPFDLYVGANVQEEVGLRGAGTAAYLIQPDLAIVLDCSPANDASGDSKANGVLGNGVLVRFLDRSMLPNRTLIQDFELLNQEAGIDQQYFYSPGGTDAGAIHKSNDGIPTLTVCICGRNLHTNSIVIDTHDYECARKALMNFIEKLNEEKIEKYKGENR